jgi:periplasmic divalent cation tolerance protein
MVSKYCVIMCAAGSREEADCLADLLVERRLAACVQILDIASTYSWHGELEHAQECLLLIKTRSALYSRVESTLRENHSYELPEILQLPVENGLTDYLNWIDENTSTEEKRMNEDH